MPRRSRAGLPSLSRQAIPIGPGCRPRLRSTSVLLACALRAKPAKSFPSTAPGDVGRERREYESTCCRSRAGHLIFAAFGGSLCQAPRTRRNGCPGRLSGTVGDFRRPLRAASSPLRQPLGAPLRTPGKRWLPDPNAFANSGRESESALSVPGSRALRSQNRLDRYRVGRELELLWGPVQTKLRTLVLYTTNLQSLARARRKAHAASASS